MNYGEEALKKHKQLKGKIGIELKDTLDSKDKLSTYYTPGVAAVSSHVAGKAPCPGEARDYTWLNNSVAVISDRVSCFRLREHRPIWCPASHGRLQSDAFQALCWY